MKTLVVDDHPGCRTMIQEILKKMGHQVDSAENGRDAVIMYVKAAENGEPYEFVSMDNEMPVMNGVQAAQMIRAFECEHSTITKKTRICFVTSDRECCCKFRKRDEEDQNTDFMEKPIDVMGFVRLVNSASGLRFAEGHGVSDSLKKAA